jgi:ATP-binding cassette, subfamily B, bacterial PglK
MIEPNNRSAGTGIFYSLRLLYSHLSKRLRTQFYLVFVLMLFGAIAELATIGAIIPFIGLISAPDEVASVPVLSHIFALIGRSYPKNILDLVVLFFVSIVLIAGSIRIALAWVSQKFAFRVGHDLSVKVYMAALYKPFAHHASTNSSDIIAGVTKAQTATFSTLLPLLNAATGAVLSITLLGAMFAIDAVIAVAATVGFGAMYIAVSYLGRNRLERNGRYIAIAQVARIRAVQEGLEGIRDVVINQVQDVYLKRFAGADLAVGDARATNSFIGTAPRFVIESLSIIIIAILALILSGKHGGLAAALPLLGAFALAGQRILPALHNIFQSWTQIKGNQQQLLDVLELIETSGESTPHLVSKAPSLPFVSDISLSNVSFKYALDGDLVLDQVSLMIKKGSRIGFIGKTGSGKSTIVDLIMGLQAPTSGHIKVDGELLTRDNIANWQVNIAHVAQHVYLADASIAENIAFGVPVDKIDHHRVQLAARRAAISGVIESLPEGYNTLVGERGARLSGGEKQRIAIARAIYKHATVLVFDEATSALDNDTEVEVMEAIQSLSENITILIISHRQSTIAECDQVVCMENGKAFVSKAAAQ